jgi:hypothetical protein
VIDRFVEILSPAGAIPYRNDRLGDRILGASPFPGEGVGAYSVHSARLADGTRVRMVSRLHSLEGRPILIRLGHTEEPLWSRLDEMLLGSMFVLPVILGSWRLRTTAPESPQRIDKNSSTGSIASTGQAGANREALA